MVDSGIADMVALTRAQIADPDLALKLREGRASEHPPLHPPEPGMPRPRQPRTCRCRAPSTRSRAASSSGRRGPTASPAALDRRRRRSGRDARGGGARPRTATRRTARARSGPRRSAAARATSARSREHRTCSLQDLSATWPRAGVDVRLGVSGHALTRCAATGPDGIVIATGAVAPRTHLARRGQRVCGGVPEGHRRRVRRARTPRRRSGGGSPSSTPTAPPTRRASCCRCSTRTASSRWSRRSRRCSRTSGAATTGRCCSRRSGARAPSNDVSQRVERVDARRARDPRHAHRCAGRARRARRDRRDRAPQSVLPDGTTCARPGQIGDAFAPRTIDAAIFDAVELAYAVAGYEALGRQT